MKHFPSMGKDDIGELSMLDTAELGTPREGKTIKTGNILKEGRGSSIFSKGLSLSNRFFTLCVEDGRPTLKYLNSETSQVLGICDLTGCVIAKSKNARKDATGRSLHCMRLDMQESSVNSDRDKLKLTLCFSEPAEMNAWHTALKWAIDFKINVQQRDMAKAREAKERRPSLNPGPLKLTKEPSWAKRKSAPDVLKSLSPGQLEEISSRGELSKKIVEEEDFSRADTRPTAKYLDGSLTQIGNMSLTGDQRFLVLNGNKKGGFLFVYDSVAQGKMISKVDLLKLEKLEIANKMVGTSLIVKEKDRSAVTFYAHDSKDLSNWGVAIALNYLACLPPDADPAPGVSDQLRQKALSSTKQSDRQTDELMEQIYATIGDSNAVLTTEEDKLEVLDQVLRKLRGFDMNAGAQHNELPGIASLLVRNGVGKAKDNFWLIIIAVEHLVQPILDSWQDVKPRIVMDVLGWIMDFEELLSDFCIEIEASAKFSSRPEYDAALTATCPRFVSHFQFFTADANGSIEESESVTQTNAWIELRAQRILVYSRIPEVGMQVTPIAVYSISRMRSFKRVPAPATIVSQKSDRSDSAGSTHNRAIVASASISSSLCLSRINASPVCTHDHARKEGRQCLCCIAFFHLDDRDVMSCFVCMSTSEQAALDSVNALQLAQRAFHSRLTGPVANEIPLFKQLYDSDHHVKHKVTENAVHDKCLQEFTRVQDRDLSTMLDACDRLLQYMKEEVRKIQRWDPDDEECGCFVATAFANIIVETVTNYLRNSAKSHDVDFIEHDEAFYLCKWSLSFQAALQAVGVYSTDVVSYDVCMFSHSLELISNYAVALSQKLAGLLKACANQDFTPDFQYDKSIKKTEAGLAITATPIDAFSFLNGIIYRAAATEHQLAIALVVFACLPVLKTFVQEWNAALQASLKTSPSFELLVPVANGMRHCSNLLVALETDPVIESVSSPESVAFISQATAILGTTFTSVDNLLADLRPHFQDAWKSCVAPLVECICSSIREILDPERVPDKHWNNGCWCCVMLYLHIIDDESGRVVKPYPQPDNSGETITIIATLQSYYEDLEQDLDRRILMLVHPQLLMRVVQLYVAKVLIPGVTDHEGLFEYRTKKDFAALLEFFSDSESHPRRTADGKPYISAETHEMVTNLGAQLKIFEQLFQEQCKIETGLSEEAADDADSDSEITNFCDQFEQLLLETDITVGVARRILEKRHDLKNRAFNDYKKATEKKCVEAVEDILQRRHSQSQPLVNVSALKIFSMASCDDVAIPWLLQNKTKLGASFDEPRKEEKAFAKRGSILGAFTASISEALSSSTASQPVATAPSAAADASDSIFSVLKRKSSALSDAIFNPSEVAGRRGSDAQGGYSSTAAAPAPTPAAAGAMPDSGDSGSKYTMVQSLLEDMGSKDLLPRFKEHDYSDDVIAEMSPADVDELFVTLKMNAGQKIKFRRELKKRGLCQG